MLNPLNFITKLIKSKNQKELDRITKIVSKINSLEEDIKKLKDVDFPKKTLELKNLSPKISASRPENLSQKIWTEKGLKNLIQKINSKSDRKNLNSNS